MIDKVDRENISAITTRLKVLSKIKIDENKKHVRNPVLEEKGSSPMSQPDKMFKVLSRPQIDLEDFLKFKKVKNVLIIVRVYKT